MQNNLWYIICSFVAGFALMSLEVIASRIVAPIIGNSIYTWTSIIGLVLLGLSVGAVLGGKMADRKDPGRILIWSLITSSLSIFLIVPMKEHTNWLTDHLTSILWLNISLSGYLFLIPSVLLGSIQPIILKKCSQSLSNLGYQYGLLSAIWSIGSILGVFVTGFLLIATLGSTTLLSSLALLLLTLALISSLRGKFKKEIACIVLAGLIVVGHAFVDRHPRISDNVLYEKETKYYSAKVIDFNLEPYGQSRTLLLDFDTHSIETENIIDQFYTEIYPAFGIFKPEIKDISVVGGGAYTLPKHLQNYYKHSRVSVIEIDPEVRDIAEQYFNLNSGQIKTLVGEARQIISSNENKYDLIYGDAYNSFISVPGHLLTLEFNEAIKKSLNPGGIYAVNFISAIEGENSRLFGSISNTFRRTFPNYYIFSFSPKTSDIQSITLIGINSSKHLREETLAAALKSGVRPFLSDKLLQNPARYLDTGAEILTDDFYPTDHLMQQTMQDYFPRFLSFLRQIYNP